MELEAQNPNREYIISDISDITKRSTQTEGRHLKTLWQQGKLKRTFRNKKYYYTLSVGQ